MSWFEVVLKHQQTGKPFVQITLVENKGSVPQVLGAKALVNADGLMEGTVGGGRVEARAIDYAKELLKSPGDICRLVTWNLIRDIGMTCGGIVTFLFEVIQPSRWHIAVFGAGHIAQEFIPLLCKLDVRVTCVDSRIEWLDKLPQLTNLKTVQLENMVEAVANMPENSFFVLMSQGHATDLPVLSEILKSRQSPYVGVIGSASKAVSLRKALREQGFSEEKIRSFFCPVGLEFGGNTPVEISYSIIGQLLQERDRLSISLTGQPAQEKTLTSRPQNPTAPQNVEAH